MHEYVHTTQELNMLWWMHLYCYIKDMYMWQNLYIQKLVIKKTLRNKKVNDPFKNYRYI